MRTGGAAQWLAEPACVNELKGLILAAARYTIPARVLGAGSNVLASDAGIRGVVIRLRGRAFSWYRFEGTTLVAGAGTPLGVIVAAAAARGYEGLSCCAGIPGTLGGALAMNAGAWGGCIGDAVQEVTVMDRTGAVRKVSRAQARFSYRHSALQRYVILEARFRLRRSTRARVLARLAELQAKRRAHQPMGCASAGSVFKNPPNDSAARLIDACGLKGVRCGDALISPRHANFIVNTGAARFRDVRALMRTAERAVARKFKIKLHPEIVIWQ
jgi:UDP-N-acetylmuramate dehydrogenase